MDLKPANPVGPCALCESNARLERGHLIPQFVYRWRKKALTASQSKADGAGDRQLQDGPTRFMLCGECEDSFSAYESEFARWVFHPFTSQAVLNAKYQSWLRKFAVSVCWRILEDDVAQNQPGRLDQQLPTRLSSCRENWKRYLAGQQPDVGSFEVHLLSLSDGLGEAQSMSAKSDNFAHVVEMEVSFSDHAPAFVYAKLGPIILFGLIEDSSSAPWLGTRINAEGKLKPREISLPTHYRAHLLSRRAGHPKLSIDR